MEQATQSPAPSMEQPPRRVRSGSVIWPLILISIGLVFLGQNLGYLPPNVWSNLWRLWPLILVLVGIEILFRGRIRGFYLGALVAGLFLVGAIALTAGSRFTIWQSSGEPRTQEFEQALAGASSATVDVEFGAGQIAIGALPAGDGRLSAMRFTGPDGVNPRVRHTLRDGTADLRFDMPRLDGPNVVPFFRQIDALALNIWLNRETPLSLEISAGASNNQFDLSELRVTRLRIETGASSTWVRMPAQGVTDARIQSGAAGITVEVPAGVSARIRHQGGVSSIEVDESRFPSIGGSTYQSADFATNPNRVELSIESGASGITVR